MVGTARTGTTASNAFKSFADVSNKATATQAGAEGFKRAGHDYADRAAQEAKREVVETMRKGLESDPSCAPIELPEFQTREIEEFMQLHRDIANASVGAPTMDEEQS